MCTYVLMRSRLVAIYPVLVFFKEEQSVIGVGSNTMPISAPRPMRSKLVAIPCPVVFFSFCHRAKHNEGGA